MAKIKGPLFSHGARGSIGRALTFRNSKNGVVAHSFGAPYSKSRQGPSNAQLQQRGIYAALAQQWKAMTAADRAQYVTGGEPLGLTGWQFYVKSFGSTGIQQGVNYCQPIAYEYFPAPDWCSVSSNQVGQITVPDDCDFLTVSITGWEWICQNITLTPQGGADIVLSPYARASYWADRSEIHGMVSPPAGSATVTVNWSDIAGSAGGVTIQYFKGVNQVNPIESFTEYGLRDNRVFDHLIEYPGASEGSMHMMTIKEYWDQDITGYVNPGSLLEKHAIMNQGACQYPTGHYNFYTKDGQSRAIHFFQDKVTLVRIIASILIRPA